MARLARCEIFDPRDVAAVHVMNRVCRRCFLLGDDPVSGKNFDHRKIWIEDELKRLAALMGIDLLGDDPRIPLDNNYGERLIRNPAVGRKNYYGSGAVWSGRLAMMMFSILATLLMWKINPRSWLSWYFEACAANNGQAPSHPENFLPWNLSDDCLESLRSPTLTAGSDTS